MSNEKIERPGKIELQEIDATSNNFSTPHKLIVFRALTQVLVLPGWGDIKLEEFNTPKVFIDTDVSKVEEEAYSRFSKEWDKMISNYKTLHEVIQKVEKTGKEFFRIVMATLTGLHAQVTEGVYRLELLQVRLIRKVNGQRFYLLQCQKRQAICQSSTN